MKRAVHVASAVFGLTVVYLVSSDDIWAHHSVNSFYDMSDPIAVEGTLTSIRWANPHVALRMERVADDGETEQWEIESGGPTLLYRLGVTEEIVAIGDRVTISGYPSRRDATGMVGVSIGLPDGRELPLFPTLAPRFGHELESGVHITPDAVEAGERGADGIFRVWTRGRGPNPEAEEPLLTQAALASKSRYDPLTDDLALRCIAPGMPIAMENPFPIEFRERDGDIVLELEVFDIVRTIHMNEDAEDREREWTPLGHSVGRWEGDTLVVTTTAIDWPYLDGEGTPQSPAMHVLERFSLDEERTRLDYEVTMTDPEYLRAPAVRYAHWLWVPGEALQSYNCTLRTTE